MTKKELKIFPLDSRENCCIYLCRIITTAEICLDRLKRYNQESKTVLENCSGSTLKKEIYEDISDKTGNTRNYLLNILGDSQDASISYFKYRYVLRKRAKKGSAPCILLDIGDEAEKCLSYFNKERNFQNHVPEAILVAEQELVNANKMFFPMNPAEIIKYEFVEKEVFEDLDKVNHNFLLTARMIVQAAKREYSTLMGETITYPRVFSDKPLSIKKGKPTCIAATRQGLTVRVNF